MRKALIRLPRTAGAMAFMVGVASAQTPSDAGRYAYHPGMWWDGGWGPMMMFGPLFMILFLAVLIAAIVLLVRWLGGPGQTTMPSNPAPPGRTPLDILKERFARGEIDKNEFEERRRVLGE